MTPGPIAINSSTFVGIRIAGVAGAFIATIGCVLPSCLIVSFLAWLYLKYSKQTIFESILHGLRPAVIALIASAGLTILILTVWGEHEFSFNVGSINFISILLFSAATFVLRKWKPNPIYVMLGSGLVGGIIYLVV